MFSLLFLLILATSSLQRANALQPNKLFRHLAFFAPTKKDDVASTRRNFRSYADDTDDTSSDRKHQQSSSNQRGTTTASTSSSSSSKIIPNLRLSQVVRSIHRRARRSNSRLLVDLGLAYATAGDDLVSHQDYLSSSDDDFADSYAEFVKRRHPSKMMPKVVGMKGKNRRKRRRNSSKIKVATAEELRCAVLDEQNELRDIELASERDVTQQHVSHVLDHDVLNVIVQRFESGSKPSARHVNDTARLALAIEGGGMRGAVPAGMAAAIACLGLCDTFDAIYGSSAGSVVGAYIVSRQMCIDVYTDLLTAAKKSFVSKGRIFAHLAKNLAEVVLTNKTSTLATMPLKSLTPGMNISFVLEGIMCPNNGLRPLDYEAFRANDALQPLRVVASSLRQGKMETVVFGSSSNDFFDEVDDDGMVTSYATTSHDGRRHGLFSCLEASMSVPGAAGPPINLVRNKDSKRGIVTTAFDAFCFEPLPYRSAVEEGATHVLVLRSRPEGFTIKTKPGVYERAVASLYFRAHSQNEVASYFERGGQQYIYAEDILTLDEAMASSEAVPVPPAKILYGSTSAQSGEAHFLSGNRRDWDKAHLLPIAVPEDTKELNSLEQGEEEVLQAVRGGFAAAYDILAPAVGLEIDGLTGKRVAELVFPFFSSTETALQQPRKVQGETIAQHDAKAADAKKHMQGRKRYNKFLKQPEECIIPDDARDLLSPLDDTKACKERKKLPSLERTAEPCPKRDALTLLAFLPGIQSGRLTEIAKGLKHHNSKSE